LIADENIPLETVELLKSQGVDIVSITESSCGLSDRKILEIAKTEERILETFDRDFGQLIFKEKLKTKGLMLLMFVPKSPQEIAKRIQQVISTNIAMDEQVVIVKKDRLKVMRPSK
jgi:predicted nuclease of predicted toxin-antitoxin system